MINIKPYTAFDYDNTRITMMLVGYDGLDPETGAYLRCSQGRRKSGRPAKWYACCGDLLVHFTASDLYEATCKANQKLNAKLQELQS